MNAICLLDLSSQRILAVLWRIWKLIVKWQIPKNTLKNMIFTKNKRKFYEQKITWTNCFELSKYEIKD